MIQQKAVKMLLKNGKLECFVGTQEVLQFIPCTSCGRSVWWVGNSVSLCQLLRQSSLRTLSKRCVCHLKQFI